LFQRIKIFSKIPKKKKFEKAVILPANFMNLNVVVFVSKKRECNLRMESSEWLHNLLVKFLSLINLNFVIGAAY